MDPIITVYIYEKSVFDLIKYGKKRSLIYNINDPNIHHRQSIPQKGDYIEVCFYEFRGTQSGVLDKLTAKILYVFTDRIIQPGYLIIDFEI